MFTSHHKIFLLTALICWNLKKQQGLTKQRDTYNIDTYEFIMEIVCNEEEVRWMWKWEYG